MIVLLTGFKRTYIHEVIKVSYETIFISVLETQSSAFICVTDRTVSILYNCAQLTPFSSDHRVK